MRMASPCNRDGVGVLGVATVATVTVAQAATDGSIYACVNASGTIHVITAGGTCGGNRVELVWNQQGPTGDTGPQGPVWGGGTTRAAGYARACGPCRVGRRTRPARPNWHREREQPEYRGPKFHVRNDSHRPSKHRCGAVGIAHHPWDSTTPGAGHGSVQWTRDRFTDRRGRRTCRWPYLGDVHSLSRVVTVSPGLHLFELCATGHGDGPTFIGTRTISAVDLGPVASY